MQLFHEDIDSDEGSAGGFNSADMVGDAEAFDADLSGGISRGVAHDMQSDAEL